MYDDFTVALITSSKFQMSELCRDIHKSFRSFVQAKDLYPLNDVEKIDFRLKIEDIFAHYPNIKIEKST